jgi:glycosyltransferase involved in cell wall biosynthesis
LRLSILLPTRNGASLLPSCVRSVLDQPFQDLELIVSDNASEDGTREVLDGLRDDPRLTVLRQDEALSVTDNWKRALAAARGDYLLLIGDDDYLMPGYCERVEALLREHGDPDVLSYSAYAFAFPGAIRNRPLAHYADPLFRADPALPEHGEVPLALRERLVRDVFRFEFGFCLNMQTTLVSRRIVDRLPNGLFHPPFPDFYAVCALLLTAERWLHTAERLAIVGISPKSFGSTFQAADQQRGFSYLGISTDFPGQLPGHELINGTYLTALQLERDFPDRLAATSVSRSDYVYIQLAFWYRQWRLGNVPRRALPRLAARLSLADCGRFLRALAGRVSLEMVRRNVRVDTSGASIEMWPGLVPAPGVNDISELPAWLERRRATV